MNQPQVPANETPEQTDIRLNKDVAAFSYVWIMSLPIYFTRKDSKFIQFHSKQGLVLFLLTIPVSFLPIFSSLLMFIIVGGMVLGFMNAANGQYRDVPIAGQLSRGELSISDIVHIVMKAGRKLLQMLKEMMKQRPEHTADKTPPTEEKK